MAGEKGGLWAAISTWLSTWSLVRAMEVYRASESQWTKNADRVDLAYRKAVADLNQKVLNVRDGIARMKNVMMRTVDQLKEANDREAEIKELLDGALYQMEQHPEESADYKEAEKAYMNLSEEVAELEAECQRLDAQLQTDQTEYDRYIRDMQGLQDEMEKLERERGRAVADFELNRVRLQLEEERANLNKGYDRSAIDTVREYNRDMSAKVEVTKALSGADKRSRDERLRDSARHSKAQDGLKTLLAKRKAEREGQTTAPPVAEKKDDTGERRQI